jgi:hypothetical protein
MSRWRTIQTIGSRSSINQTGRDQLSTSQQPTRDEETDPPAQAQPDEPQMRRYKSDRDPLERLSVAGSDFIQTILKHLVINSLQAALWPTVAKPN